jgi:hypothetical protein
MEEEETEEEKAGNKVGLKLRGDGDADRRK